MNLGQSPLEIPRVAFCLDDTKYCNSESKVGMHTKILLFTSSLMPSEPDA